MAMTITGIRVEFRLGHGTGWIFALVDGGSELGPFLTSDEAMHAVVQAIEERRRHAPGVSPTRAA